MSSKRKHTVRAWPPGSITIEDEVFEIDMDRRVYRVTNRGRRRVKDMPTMQRVADALAARRKNNI